MSSMSGMRIAGDNRLCHARAGIVTNEAMMMTAWIPRAAAIGRIPGGDPSIFAAALGPSVRSFRQKGLRAQTDGATPRTPVGPQSPSLGDFAELFNLKCGLVARTGEGAAASSGRQSRRAAAFDPRGSMRNKTTCADHDRRAGSDPVIQSKGSRLCALRRAPRDRTAVPPVT